MLTPVIVRLRRNGIVYPIATRRAALTSKLGLPLACGLLMQESGGGRNEFGHDPTIAAGWGEVTRQRYLAYKVLRDTMREYQGVGPCQLTSPGYQDEADRLGGCWNPESNMRVGFKALHDLIVAHGLRDGVVAYNGSGPAAERYATHVLALAEFFKGQGCGSVVGVLH